MPDAERSAFMLAAINKRWQAKQEHAATLAVCRTCVHFTPDEAKKAKFGVCQFRVKMRDPEVTHFDTCEKHAFR